jgi:hypothetical protein
MLPIRIVAYNMSLLRSSGLWFTFRLYKQFGSSGAIAFGCGQTALRLRVSVAKIKSSTVC